MASESYSSYPNYWTDTYVEKFGLPDFNYNFYKGLYNSKYKYTSYEKEYDYWDSEKLYEIGDYVVYNENLYMASKFIYLNDAEGLNPEEAKTNIDGRDFRVWIFVSSYNFAKAIYLQQNNTQVWVTSDTLQLDTKEEETYPNGEFVPVAPLLSALDTSYGSLEIPRRNNHIKFYSDILIDGVSVGLGTDDPFKTVEEDPNYLQEYPDGSYWSDIKLNSRRMDSYSPYLFSPEDDLITDSDNNSTFNPKYSDRVFFEDENDSFNKIERYASSLPYIGHSKEKYFNFRSGMTYDYERWDNQEYITPPDNEFFYILRGSNQVFDYNQYNLGSIYLTEKYGGLFPNTGTTIRGEVGITKHGNPVYGDENSPKTPISNIWIFCSVPMLIDATALIRLRYTRTTVNWTGGVSSPFVPETTNSDESIYWEYKITEEDIINSYSQMNPYNDEGDSNMVVMPFEWITVQYGHTPEIVRRKLPTDFTPDNVRRIIDVPQMDDQVPEGWYDNHINISYLTYHGARLEKLIT